jgi:hypothetical protein
MSDVSNIQSGPAPGGALKQEIDYNLGRQRAEVTDARGRKIKIRKLMPLDRLRLFEALGAVLSENAMYFSYTMSVACIEEIDGNLYGIPTSKIQIEAMISRLDDHGLEAVARGYRENFGSGETGDPEAIKK